MQQTIEGPDTNRIGAPHEDLAIELARRVGARAPVEAVGLLEPHPEALIVQVLRALNPSTAQNVLDRFPTERQRAIIAAAPPDCRRQWLRNEQYAEGTVGRLMEPQGPVFSPDLTVGEAVERLREIVKTSFITYGFVTDAEGRLKGVVVMRDLLFAERQTRLGEIMVRDPFYLKPGMTLMDAMKLALYRHYPEYPVCDAAGRLIGSVRGQTMFEAQAFEVSAQAGSMVGVEKEERLATPWRRSLKLRHPWLQLNLFTAFLAGGVVTIFQQTINEIVVLAVFLPILAGQSGNTGCQALAVTLRGMTLGELRAGDGRKLVFKEGFLGLLNGAFVGLSAAIAMIALAAVQGNPLAVSLGLLVFVAMIASCVVSGVAGALVPLTLVKLGADPATASSIFLTTATDVASMGLLLGLATWFLR